MLRVGCVLSAPQVGATIWTLVSTCLRSEAVRQRVTLTSRFAATSEEQLQELERLLAQGVDALIMWPMGFEAAAAQPFLRKAQAAGVPLVTLDSSLADAAVVCTVGSDNTHAQAAMSRFVFDKLGGRGRVAYFQGDARVPSGAARNASFHEVLKAYPGIELVYEAMLDWIAPAGWRARGTAMMTEALARHGAIDAVIVASDHPALGAIDAIEEAGLAGRILVSGFDALPEALVAIGEGSLLATIRQNTTLIAREALAAAVAAAERRPVERIVRVPADLVTQDNVVESALDALTLVPGLLVDLSENYSAQQDLQRAVIAKQARILKTVIAVSDAASRERDPRRMTQEFIDLVRVEFDLTLVEAAIFGHGDREAAWQAQSQRAPAPAATLDGVASTRVLSIQGSGRAIGSLTLHSDRPAAFGDEERGILEAITHQLAAALENSQLHAETIRLAESEMRESQAKLVLAERAEFLSNHDALTSLPNRRAFIALLEAAVSEARRAERHLAVVFIDLDRFKRINDTLGHAAGDNLLQQAALRLKAAVRDSDVVARLGGDEFVLLLRDCDHDDAARFARAIVVTMARPFVLIGHEFDVTASVGVSVYPEAGSVEPQSLMKNADIAMYQAKTEGKNNFQFFEERLSTDSAVRHAFEASLRQALERDEFRLYYQAKRETSSGRITGMEVLLRWEHPELGTMHPAQFLSAAEETGLIVPLGRWVLRTACQQNAKWQAQGLPPMIVSVNISQRQFADEALVGTVKSVLAETGMAARWLELEIGEKTLMRDYAKTLATLGALRDEGVRLAVDDFGMGYASLTALSKYPLDTIKIHRSFVRGLSESPASADVAEAILAMGRTLSLTIVAQGVETKRQADFLREHDCDEVQGFYIDAPMPTDQFADLLRDAGRAA